MLHLLAMAGSKVKPGLEDVSVLVLLKRRPPNMSELIGRHQVKSKQHEFSVEKQCNGEGSKTDKKFVLATWCWCFKCLRCLACDDSLDPLPSSRPSADSDAPPPSLALRSATTPSKNSLASPPETTWNSLSCTPNEQ
jgi:hypothetical protein